MKKTNFFKLLMVGALTLSLGLAGCKFASEDDIKDVCETIDLMKSDIAGLNTRLNAVEQGNYVTDVTQPVPGTIRVTYKTGTPIDLVIGTIGTNVPKVTIGNNGNWYIDGEDSGYSVFGPAPIVEDGKWKFPVLKNGEVAWEEGDDAIYNAYVTEANGVFTLFVADDKGVLQEIPLPSVGGGISKIDILGWTTGKDGKASDKLVLGATAGVAGDVDNETDLDVEYAYIAAFFQEDDFFANDDDAQDAMGAIDDDKYFWEGTKTVKKKNILNTLEATRTGLIVQVHPATVDLSKVALSLENSKGVALPIAVGTPVLSTGLLTRAAGSGVWFVPLTFEEGKIYDDKDEDYLDLFENNAIYSLVWNEKLRSEYTEFYITSVAEAESAEEIASVKDATVIVAADTDAEGFYAVEVNKPYSIDLSGDGNNIDYYIEVKDKNAEATSAFGVEIDVEAGTFTVSKQPDQITWANLTLTIYKLGIDGKIYVQDIKVRPSNATVSGTIAIGNYLVEDVDKDPAAVYLGAKKGVSLDPMFSSMSAAAKARWQGAANGANKVTLKKVVIGGKEVNEKDYVDKANADDKPSLTDWAAMFKANTATYGFATKADGTGLIGIAADGTAEGALNGTTFFYMQPAWTRDAGEKPMFDIGSTYELTFEFSHTSEVEGEDVDDYLSTAVVTFTPTIPPLGDMFAKETSNEGGLRYWTGSTLNGYYRAPESGATDDDDYYYKDGQDDDAPWEITGDGSTFYSVFADAVAVNDRSNEAPADGGFNKFPLEAPDADVTSQWSLGAGLAFREVDEDGNPTQLLDPEDEDSTIDNYVILGKAAEGQGAIVELINQTPNATTSAIGYNTPLKLKVVPGKYLGVYDYPASDDLNFDLVLNSAVEKGDIVGTSAQGMVDIKIGSTDTYYKLYAKDFKATNVAGTEYSLFTKTGVYAYSYIRNVVFSVPSGVTAYTLVNGVTVDNVVTATEINGADDGEGGVLAPHIGIQSSITKSGTSNLNVTVYDRFGKAKTATVKLNFVN